MVCAECVNKPDPVPAGTDISIADFVNVTKVPVAFAGGVAGSLLGGLAWGGASAALGTSLGVFGILAGIGARLGVRAALPYRSGCAWPLVCALSVFPGYAFGRYLTALVAARTAAGGSVGLFDPAVWKALAEIVTKGFGLLELCWIAVAVAAATMRLRR